MYKYKYKYKYKNNLKNINFIYKKFINKILRLLKYFNLKECFGYKYMMNMVNKLTVKDKNFRKNKIFL